MRRATYRLTRSVEATVFSGESESGRPPKVVAVVIRPKVGSGGDVSVFAVQQLTAEMLRSGTIRDTNADDPEFHNITEADPWAKLRTELLDAAAIFPDYAPSEFDTEHATQLLEQLTATIDKLRDEIQLIQDRLAGIDSEEQLAYVETDTNPTPTHPPIDIDRSRVTLKSNRDSTAEREPETTPVISETRVVPSATELVDPERSQDELHAAQERIQELVGEVRQTVRRIQQSTAEIITETTQVSPEPKPPLPENRIADLRTANLKFNRRTGLWVDTTHGRTIVALPSQDGVAPALDPRLLLFDVTQLPKAESDAPDFILRKRDGYRFHLHVKRWSVLRDTQAIRPRQISAAIAALEARQRGEHVAGRYAVTAKTLGIPPEKPIIVQRLIASVMTLISNPETEMLIRFLAPHEVNIDKVIKQVQDGKASVTNKKKSRKKK